MNNPLQLRLQISGPHRNQYLFSDHYLENILPNDPRWESSLSEAQDFLSWLKDLYASEQKQLSKYNESQPWNEDCFKAFVKMLAGRIANLSDVVSDYRKHHPDYRQLVQRIESTNWLIDQIVYRLYGLTEGEIAIVEKGNN